MTYDEALAAFREAMKADLACPGPPEEQDRLHALAAEAERVFLEIAEEDSH